MNVICLEDPALYALIDELAKRINADKKKHDKWISGEEAMKMLRITSKATLQKFRNEGKIRISQPEKKIILYDTDSIFEFLEKHAKNTF